MALQRSLACVAPGLACAVTTLQAHAVDLSGTFSGTATSLSCCRTRGTRRTPRTTTRVRVSGSFVIHVVDPQFETSLEGIESIYSDAAGCYRCRTP